MSTPALQEAFCAVAAAWRDPDYDPRSDAVEKTLAAPNQFTEEAIAFALNQALSQCTAEQLERWITGRQAREARTVAVLSANAVPFEGFWPLVAVLLLGHRYVGSVEAASPYLLPAFLDDVRAHAGEVPGSFVEEQALYDQADALWAPHAEAPNGAREHGQESGIPPERIEVQGRRHAVAVIDGHESDEEREGLAEDILLHEGQSENSVQLIWAPRDLSPDPYLEAMAHFRGVFPVHPDTPGTLTMHKALLEARDIAHAYGEGLEFLVSKGPPEVQKPAHVRWTEYDALEDVAQWLAARDEPLSRIVARREVAQQLSTPGEGIVGEPGQAHRVPPSEEPILQEGVDFLGAL